MAQKSRWNFSQIPDQLAITKTSGKLGRNQQRKGPWGRLEGQNKQKCQAKLPHYNCGCLCSQLHSNCTAAAFLLVLARIQSLQTIPSAIHCSIDSNAGQVPWFECALTYLVCWPWSCASRPEAWKDSWEGATVLWSEFNIRGSSAHTSCTLWGGVRWDQRRAFVDMAK